MPPPLVLIVLIVHLAPGMHLSLGAPFTLTLNMPLIIIVLLTLLQVTLTNGVPFTLLLFRLDLICGDGTFCVDGEALYDIHFPHLLALCEKAWFYLLLCMY